MVEESTTTYVVDAVVGAISQQLTCFKQNTISVSPFGCTQLRAAHPQHPQHPLLTLSSNRREGVDRPVKVPEIVPQQLQRIVLEPTRLLAHQVVLDDVVNVVIVPHGQMATTRSMGIPGQRTLGQRTTCGIIGLGVRRRALHDPKSRHAVLTHEVVLHHVVAVVAMLDGQVATRAIVA